MFAEQHKMRKQLQLDYFHSLFSPSWERSSEEGSLAVALVWGFIQSVQDTLSVAPWTTTYTWGDIVHFIDI